MTGSQILDDSLPLQTGGLGLKEALFPSAASVQVASSSPLSSYPVLHVYVAVLPMVLPVTVTPPFSGFSGLSQVTITAF